MGLLAKLRGRRGLPSPPTYSNEAVIARIEREEGVSRETARGWFGEMLVFLDLCAGSDEMLSPPSNVDKAWHAFLLHSRDYEAYCRERFGRVIHHQPTGAPDAHAYRRAYERRAAYGSGTPDPLMWALPAGVVVGSDEGEDEQDRSGAPGGGAAGCGGGFGGDGDKGSSDGGFASDAGGASCGGGGCGGGGG